MNICLAVLYLLCVESNGQSNRKDTLGASLQLLVMNRPNMLHFPLCLQACMFSYLKFFAFYNNGKGKGKVRPRTVHEGPIREYRYSSTLSLTSVLDGVGRQRHARQIYPLERTGIHCIGG
jgi:hypothetical protein